MKNINKIFVIFAIVFLNVFSTQTFAQTEWSTDDVKGNGTKAEPWLITKAKQLKDLADYVNENKNNSERTANKYYKLMENIDLSDYAQGAGWMPIGSKSNPFKGHFDGNKKVVKNLRINRPDIDNVGLFGYTEGDSIQKLGIENCNIEGKNCVGGLVGNNKSTTIINCYVTGNIKGTDSVAGVAGANSGLIKYCYTTGKVVGSKSVGCIAGTSYGNMVRIQYCVAAQDSLIGNSTVSRIAPMHYDDKNVEHINRQNYAYDGMVVLQGGEIAKLSGNTRNRSDGESKSITLLQNRFFFYIKTTYWGAGIWDFENVWQINNEKLSGDSSRFPVFIGQEFPKINPGTYYENDKEALRRFLRQPSAQSGKLNLEQLGLEIADTANWTKEEEWITKIRFIYWNIEKPKRLIGIGNADFSELKPGETKAFGGWSTMSLQGNLDATSWTKLECLKIHTSSDRLLPKDEKDWNHIQSLTLGSNTVLKMLICGGNDLTHLDVSGCTALTRLLCTLNSLTDVNLGGLNFDDFSAGGQKVSLTLVKNSDGTYSCPVTFNNPAFFRIDVTDSASTFGNSISYANGIFTSTDSTIGRIGFVANTNVDGKKVGGTIELNYTTAPDDDVPPLWYIVLCSILLILFFIMGIFLRRKKRRTSKKNNPN